MSKDVAVAIWQQFGVYSKQTALRGADLCGFVIVNSELHNEFDAFMTNELKPNTVYLEINALLRHYLTTTLRLSQRIVHKYGVEYLCLEHTEVDDLCQWVEELRDLHIKVGSAAFSKGIVNLQ